MSHPHWHSGPSGTYANTLTPPCTAAAAPLGPANRPAHRVAAAGPRDSVDSCGLDPTRGILCPAGGGTRLQPEAPRLVTAHFGFRRPVSAGDNVGRFLGSGSSQREGTRMRTQTSPCPNLNHRRSDAPVRCCPMCGELVNQRVARKKCVEATHARSRQDRNKYCADCGEQLIGDR